MWGRGFGGKGFEDVARHGPRFIVRCEWDLTWLALAHGERVALVAGLALAHRRMVDHPAHGRDAARARARVRAALVHARQVRTTFGAERALGPAVRGATDIVGQTGAGGQLVDGAAQGVGAARRRLARIDVDVADGWLFYVGSGAVGGD